MSTSLMGACWPLQMSPTQKAVLISLADQANDDGVCWPRIETIVSRTCLSDRAVQQALRWLVEHGAVQEERRYKRSTVFTVTPQAFQGESPSPEAGSPERPSPEAPSPEADSLSGERGAPDTPKQLHPYGERGAPRIIKEPSKESSKNHQRARARGQPRAKSNPNPAQPALPTKFERWWQTWPKSPRKVGKSDCEKRWKRHGLDVHAEVIIAHTTAMKLSKQWKTGFDPAPATYLNQERWRDDVPPDQSELQQEGGGVPWWESASGTEAKGRELGIEPRPGEITADYLVRVAQAAGRGPWIDAVLKREQRSPERFQRIAAFFGDKLMPVDWYA